MNIDGVEADKYPKRVSWLKRQAEKTKLLQEEREQRADQKDKQGENDE